MSIRIPIRKVLALRGEVREQTLLDYLELRILTPDEPGIVDTKLLRQRWRCSQPMVSRRMAAVQSAGLADITSGYGCYKVHWFDSLEVA